jgi:hypothetical protein
MISRRVSSFGWWNESGASTPARRTNARVLPRRHARLPHDDDPATTPNATCDAMNQVQSMRLSSKGFRRPRIEYKQSRPQYRADQSAEHDRPLRNIGSIAP